MNSDELAKNDIELFASTSQVQNNNFFANGSNNGNDFVSVIPKTFECSHELDNNSLKALHHDDDEDQVWFYLIIFCNVINFLYKVLNLRLSLLECYDF